MKKLLFITSLFCVCALTATHAQVTSSAGVKVQANYSKYRISGMPGTDSKFGFGASAGGFVKVGFGEYFALQPELLFNLYNNKLKEDGTGKFRYLGLEIPVYAVGQLPLGDGKLFLGAGPYASYGLSNKVKDGSSVNLYKKQDGQDKAAMHRFDYGAGGILGYEFESGFILNAGYQMSFRNTLRTPGSSMKATSFSLGVGYKF